MTMDAKLDGAAERAGASVVTRSTAVAGKAAWAKVWQVPLLLAGVIAFGMGVRAVVRAHKPIPFETHLADVRTMLAAGQYEKVIDRINVLGGYYQAPAQLAQLEAVAGDAHYLAQQHEPAFVRENYQHVADHYRKAVALGVKPDATTNERWGEAALAIGDAPLALDKLEAAIEADAAKLRPHVRDLVAAYVASGDMHKARLLLAQLLKQPDATVDERAWSLCKRIELAMQGGGGGAAGVPGAIEEAREGLKTIPERDPAGRVLLAIGRAEFDGGHFTEAQTDLTDARSRFVIHHMDDGRAAVLLGKLAQARGDQEKARQLFDEIALSHRGTTIWSAARFGRAECAAARGDTGQAMQDDYRFVLHALQAPTDSPSVPDATVGVATGPEMVTLDQVRASFIANYDRSIAANKLDDALLFLTLQGEMNEPETAATAFRLATTQEGRATKLALEAAAIPETDVKSRADKEREALAIFAQSAEAWRLHAKLITLDDALSGNSLWHAAQLFDRAGRTKDALAAFEKFTTERPHDPRVPEGLLAMGRQYQSAAMIDDAIAVYQRNIRENGKTPAAYTSAVNLARCYMVQGPDKFPLAEKALLSLVQDNLDLDPAANEFRISLFTLGELYYTNGKWADAILRLEEATERYPQDKAVPRALFMLAESYRKSACDIADAIKKNPGIEHRDALIAAREDRLRRAASIFAQVIAALDVDTEEVLAGHEPHLTPLEDDYLRTSYMDRAGCYYDLNELPTAIKFYDQTATRFAQHVLAIESYVQIVNAYVSMNEPGRADAAAERAQWILKRIPDDAFSKGPAPASRQYYEDFFKLGRTRQGAT